MPLALLIFGVAFAAICILLTARIVNRQRWAKWSLAGVIGVLLLYAVSFGPACWISSHLGDGRFVSAMYQPVFRFWWNDGAPDWNDRLHRYMRCRANQDWNVVLEAKSGRYRWDDSAVRYRNMPRNSRALRRGVWPRAADSDS
jgi:hypothetical protein